MYWLFKRYMKRLVADYHKAYEHQFDKTQAPDMRPDFYWLEKFMRGDF